MRFYRTRPSLRRQQQKKQQHLTPYAHSLSPNHLRAKGSFPSNHMRLKERIAHSQLHSNCSGGSVLFATYPQPDKHPRIRRVSPSMHSFIVYAQSIQPCSLSNRFSFICWPSFTLYLYQNNLAIHAPILVLVLLVDPHNRLSGYVEFSLATDRAVAAMAQYVVKAIVAAITSVAAVLRIYPRVISARITRNLDLALTPVQLCPRPRGLLPLRLRPWPHQQYHRPPWLHPHPRLIQNIMSS